MQLIRDVLDKQLVDKTQVRIGRADGIILRAEVGRPPKVEAIELGRSTLIRRLLVGMGLRTPAHHPNRGYRISWSKVTDVGVDVTVDVDHRETPLEQWEEWLRRNVMRRIPGGLS
ncbi:MULTISPECIES: hypothetical protein [unclassified Sinorhizobium]|uniref:hypothetical protein n=1 Tax=unclassified Sinorhizobium TaxID=2613772 RepID=UPI00352655EF